jgi:ABC-type polysaccharide/polyol phosphate transport system ATPase subunit
VTEAARVVASRVGKRYPHGAWALRDVSFGVPAGSVLGIVGENGSGKSTLLDLLMGVTRPSEGSLQVRGPLASIVELGAGFFWELTGEENAIQAALLAGLSRTEAGLRARAVEDFAELGDFFRKPVSTYSAGMVLRLGFAVAAFLEMPLTIIDEVLAVGDGYFQRKCIDRILDVRHRGGTLVIASHDLHALRSLCDRVLWLRLGKVEALGDASTIINRYDESLRRRAAASSGLAPGRSGTGEVAIREVRLRDGSGREREEFRTGETVRVDVLFETARPVESPIMGVAIFRDDGVYCYGPNTGFDGCLGGTYDGRYRLTAEFSELPLLGGAYQLSVAFYDKDHVYAYAWDHRLYPFRIVADRPEHGLVLLRHRFDVEKVDA